MARRRRRRNPRPPVAVQHVERRRAQAAIVDRHGRPAGVEDLWLNGHVFLVLGGPSLAELELDRLYERGIVTLAVNNVAAVVRPNIWTMGDRPQKFHDVIWRDPGILKVIPFPKFGSHVRTRNPDGSFYVQGDQLGQLPGIYGVRRNSAFDPDKWLHESTVNWGNGKKAAIKNGHPRVLSTMVQAVRLCYYLGFRWVYLLGCDFSMSREQPYCFTQSKPSGGVGGNNSAYGNISALFEMLRPKFEEANFRVFNCAPSSGLRVFPHLPFDEAIDWAQKDMPRNLDTDGWYDL